MMVRPKSPDLAGDPFFPRLKAFVIGATGMEFYADKDDDLARIVNLRLKALDISGCARYLDILGDPANGRKELDELVAELTIGETYFFRHGEQFDALRDVVLPDVIRRNQDSRRIRIWSAGCSIGAEPYTISIILGREFRSRLAGWSVDIVGTDINKRFLALARRARFKEWAMRAMPDDLREACFLRHDKEWELKPQFRDPVSFQYHNLVENPFPSLIDNLCAFDVILCRNVTIYFDRPTVRRLVGQFRETLTEGGWLLAGHSENDLEIFRNFRLVTVPGAAVYQKSREPDLDRGYPFPEPEPPAAAGEPLSISLPADPPPAMPVAPPVEAEPSSEPDAAPSTPYAEEIRRIRRLADLGQWWDAIGRCEALLDTGANDPVVHLYYALVLEQMGKQAAAEQALRRAVFLDRGFVLAHYHLGLFLLARGDLEGSSKSFKTVRRLLEGEPDGGVIDDEDGISVRQLRDMAGMHLEVIGQS
jgi:chemotaxis protein methyltransferase CheR